MKPLAFLSVVSVCAALFPVNQAQAQPAGGGNPTKVIISKAYNKEFVDRVEAIGTLRANETVTLAATVTDTVTDINFTDGQQVAKGDILVEMTSTEEAALIDQQRALVNEASKQLQRTRDLAKNGAASTSILDERQREFTSAKAGMAALQSRLEDRIITAPFDGVVGLRNISVGALLQPGTQITTLDDISTMKLDFSVPSIYLPSLQTGLKITAKATGFEKPFEGEVTAINSQIDPITRAVTVRAMIPNPDGMLKPGLLMTVELMKNPRDAVTIPETAIIPEGRSHFVLVIDQSKTLTIAEKRKITIGTRIPGSVEVVDGLKQGEAVVTQGTMTARPGQPVSVTTEQKPDETLENVLKRLQTAAQQEAPEKE